MQQWDNCIFYGVCSEATIANAAVGVFFGPFPGYIAWTSAGSVVSSELSLQLIERVSCEGQSEEAGSGPWLGGHGQSS
jgi:hypothetical protein